MKFKVGKFNRNTSKVIEVEGEQSNHHREKWVSGFNLRFVVESSRLSLVPSDSPPSYITDLHVRHHKLTEPNIKTRVVND